APRTQSGRRHVAPVRPVVLGEPQPRIVGTGPEHAFLRGRGRERIDDRVAAGGARPAGRLALALRLRVLVGEDGADHLPVLAGIRGPHDLLTPHVQGVGLERRGCERGVPGVVGAGGSRRAAKGPDRRRRYAHGDVRALVVAGDGAAGAGTEDDRRIPLARDQVARFAAADRVPVVVGDDAGGAARRYHQGPRILLGGVEVVRHLVVHAEVVDLGRGLVEPARPVRAVVE